MSYKQIDEQFDEKFGYIVMNGSLPGECSVGYVRERDERIKSFLHLIYDQAKAEWYQEAIEDTNEDKAYKENKL